ncbi:MAG: hypothetical protein HF300_08335 [Ignavibacteria bacterium]|jgi:hypothetical protein|nr:hypothetical protein [Ignavibacteria bacterium]HEX2964057.1 hypothetical protein [Ignavibacteriales bacterium]MCU7499324.1 hypothetical protein [Ignavibacteria bacterium]MCU7512553.1 hypothetical protein [Ignavibacteria bacterium]MCU7519670.1 hypothetical protein [Ignavibacteria bacterium]
MPTADQDNAQEHMYTLSQTINHLRDKGYTNDFKMTDLGMTSKETKEVFKPEELTIERVYRFEGESNPDDMSVIYLIKADNGTKGLFVDAYGAYSSYDGIDLMEFLKKVKREDNNI